MWKRRPEECVSRLMHRTVSIVKLVISRTQVKTSTGCARKEARDLHMMECENEHFPRGHFRRQFKFISFPHGTTV